LRELEVLKEYSTSIFRINESLRQHGIQKFWCTYLPNYTASYLKRQIFIWIKLGFYIYNQEHVNIEQKCGI